MRNVRELWELSREPPTIPLQDLEVQQRDLKRGVIESEGWILDREPDSEGSSLNGEPDSESMAGDFGRNLR